MVINHLDHFSKVVNEPSVLPATLDTCYQDDFPALPRPGEHPLVKKDILVEHKLVSDWVEAETRRRSAKPRKNLGVKKS